MCGVVVDQVFRGNAVGSEQRTDATHVLAAIRVLNRLELVAETLRAALNELATVAPTWLQRIAPPAWYERYSKRIEETLGVYSRGGSVAGSFVCSIPSRFVCFLNRKLLQCLYYTKKMWLRLI